MIDWAATRDEFGSVDLTEYRPKVIVRCDECNKSSTYTIRVKSKLKDDNINWLCTKCACNKKSVRDKLSISTKKSWENNEYVEKQKNKSKRLWADELYKDKHHNAVNTKESKRKCSEAAIKAWKDNDYREKHAVAFAKQLKVIPNTEKKIHSILDKLGINYNINHVIGPYTFDVFIKRNNCPDLLVEVNGNYWHTRPYVMRKDLAKVSYISQLSNYELKTIWEHQLFDVKRCKQLICDWLGMGSIRRVVNCRNVVFTKCPIDKMREFMSNFHYLGSMGRAGLHICGSSNDEIICGMILAHPTRKEIYSSLGLLKDEALELTRFCISPHIKCQNLASYALSKLTLFVPNKIKCLISFASPGDGHKGTIYKAANWVPVGETARSYFYIKKDGWKMHKKTLYNQARGAHLKEAEFAKKFGYQKIWLPPLKKFVYENI